MDNHQWRLSQAYTYAFNISIHISITLILYHLIFLLHVNLFLLHVLCLWHILYLYFFLYSYFYTLHIPILIMCSSFMLVICLFNVPILFQVTYHVSFHVVATRPCYTIHFLNIVLSYIFLYDLVLSYTLHLRFHSDYRIGIHDRFEREPRPVCHSIAM